MKHITWISCAALSVFPVLACASPLQHSLNYIGIYGEAIGTPDSYNSFNTQDFTQSFKSMKPAAGGNTSGGVGVVLNGISHDNVLLHLGFNYGFSPIIGDSNGNTSNSGHSMAFNARLGKGFQFSPNLIVGPYIGYQYAQFKLGIGDNGNFGNATYNNNTIGGGLFLAMEPVQDLTLSAHAGYMVGISSNEKVNFSDLSVQPGGVPSANVFQVGGKLSYRFLPNVSGFIGVNYDRYLASKQFGPINVKTRVNSLRGMVGVAYNF